jgi:hypothetical protein
MFIGSIAAGAAVVQAINLQYMPQMIAWELPASGDIQNVKVEVLGTGVVVDLDHDGIVACSTFLQKGAGFRVLNLANGLIKNKTVVVTLTGNTSSAAINVYAAAEQAGNIYVRHNKYTVLANNNVSFREFAVLYLPNLASGDKVTTTYVDGTTQIWEDVDFMANSLYFENAPQMLVNNIANNVQDSQVLVATQQLVYITDYLAA